MSYLTIRGKEQNMKIINLKKHVENNKKDYEGKPDWMWEDEGIVYAIQDYLAMKGEFSEEDNLFLKSVGFSKEDFIEK